MKKVLCLALVITSFIILPVSVFAVDPVYVDVLDYAVCYFASNTSAPNRGTIVRQYPYTFPASPAYPTVGYYAQLKFEPNTTYVLSWTFETDQPELFQGFFEVMEANSYTINSTTGALDIVSWSGSSKIDNSFIAYNQQIGDTLVITELAFNTGNIPNLVTGLPMYVIYRGSGSVKGVTVKDFAMSAYATYDPSGDQLNSILVNMVGDIQQDLENYHTNALEVLDAISVQLNNVVNSGSEHSSTIPSNGNELSSTVTDLDNAEQDLYNKSDSLIESVQSQLDQSKNQAVAALPNLTTSALAVTNVYNMIKSILPDEVKILFVVVPVILFFAYLIGRKD